MASAAGPDEGHVYIPIGHGGEDFTRSRGLIPPGCTLTVIETPNSEHYCTNGLYEYEKLKEFLILNGNISRVKEIFKNPIKNSKIIYDIFGSVAIFTPGQKCPNIDYSLFLEWHTLLYDPETPPYNITEYHDIRYSGLIEFDTFISPEFTVKNMMNKMNPATIKYTDVAGYSGHREEWLQNMLEIYKFSIYPSPADFTKYFSTSEGLYDFVVKDKEFISEPLTDGQKKDTYLSRVAYDLFQGKIGSTERNLNRRNKLNDESYINVSLLTLMQKFPGNYIHFVCRSVDGKVNSNVIINHATKEEISIKRVPYMSEDQKRSLLNIIRQSKLKGQRKKFRPQSSVNIRNVMETALLKSLTQKEFLNKLKNKSRKRKRSENGSENEGASKLLKGRGRQTRRLKQ